MNATSRALASPLANRTYRHLYLAQIGALTGTGVMTVGLALLAYQLAGDDAGAVLGIALSLRVVAFVLISPLFGAYAHLLPRRRVLVGLDLLRAATVLVLPFVDAVWQVYVLIFVINAASAGLRDQCRFGRLHAAVPGDDPGRPAG
jgi:MFS family permease